MTKSSFNMKHPKTHEYIANHELGHIDDFSKQRKVERVESLSSKGVMQLPADVKELGKEFIKLNKNTSLSDIEREKKESELVKREEKIFNKYKTDKDKYKEIEDYIRKQVHENKVKTSHGNEPDEYRADNYAVNNIKHGKDVQKKAFKDMKKSVTKASDEDIHINEDYTKMKKEIFKSIQRNKSDIRYYKDKYKNSIEKIKSLNNKSNINEKRYENISNEIDTLINNLNHYNEELSELSRKYILKSHNDADNIQQRISTIENKFEKTSDKISVLLHKLDNIESYNKLDRSIRDNEEYIRDMYHSSLERSKQSKSYEKKKIREINDKMNENRKTTKKNLIHELDSRRKISNDLNKFNK